MRANEYVNAISVANKQTPNTEREQFLKNAVEEFAKQPEIVALNDKANDKADHHGARKAKLDLASEYALLQQAVTQSSEAVGMCVNKQHEYLDAIANTPIPHDRNNNKLPLLNDIKIANDMLQNLYGNNPTLAEKKILFKSYQQSIDAMHEIGMIREPKSNANQLTFSTLIETSGLYTKMGNLANSLHSSEPNKYPNQAFFVEAAKRSTEMAQKSMEKMQKSTSTIQKLVTSFGLQFTSNFTQEPRHVDRFKADAQVICNSKNYEGSTDSRQIQKAQALGEIANLLSEKDPVQLLIKMEAKLAEEGSQSNLPALKASGSGYSRTFNNLLNITVGLREGLAQDQKYAHQVPPMSQNYQHILKSSGNFNDYLAQQAGPSVAPPASVRK
jgi:hypothetical protein